MAVKENGDIVLFFTGMMFIKITRARLFICDGQPYD
jgi:hypothetical protein